MNRLEFDSIEISFGGQRLLSSIYMVCDTGKITGLLGRNGCGKTTLMKIVFGAIPLEQKSVRVNDCSLGMSYLSKQVIAYLPQTGLIPPYLTVRKAFSLFNIDEDEIMALFPEVTDMLLFKPPQLSGGYLRIFEIFLILRSKALFCLLDEPFTGLTPVYIEKIKELLKQSKSEKGIIISDHMHRHVTEISDLLYLLTSGKTYHVSHPDQLISLGYLNGVP